MSNQVTIFQDETPVYVVLSIRELLQMLAVAQTPASDGGTEVKISNCIVVEGRAHIDQIGKVQLFDHKTRRS